MVLRAELGSANAKDYRTAGAWGAPVILVGRSEPLTELGGAPFCCKRRASIGKRLASVLEANEISEFDLWWLDEDEDLSVIALEDSAIIALGDDAAWKLRGAGLEPGATVEDPADFMAHNKPKFYALPLMILSALNAKNPRGSETAGGFPWEDEEPEEVPPDELTSPEQSQPPQPSQPPQRLPLGRPPPLLLRPLPPKPPSPKGPSRSSRRS